MLSTHFDILIAPPLKKRCVNGAPANGEDAQPSKLYHGSPADPATEEDKRQWQGFCEIESEPVCVFGVSRTAEAIADAVVTGILQRNAEGLGRERGQSSGSVRT